MIGTGLVPFLWYGACTVPIMVWGLYMKRSMIRTFLRFLRLPEIPETPETPDGKHHSQKLKHIKQPRVIGEEGWKDGDVEG